MEFVKNVGRNACQFIDFGDHPHFADPLSCFTPYIFRHTAAKLRRDARATMDDASRFLDHSSLAVTTVYLRGLEGEQDKSWAKVAEAIGIKWRFTPAHEGLCSIILFSSSGQPH